MQNTYTETFSVRATDCDKFKRMRLDMLFIAMQEGGERHAQMLGVGYEAMMNRGLFFVLARIHVKTVRAPRVGDTVVHTTWPGKSNRFFCPRYHTFTLADGTPLLSAAALWVVLDTVNRRIVSPLSLNLGLPENSEISEPIALPTRLPASISGAQLFTRSPVYSEFDINGHVNNTKYIAWLCDALGSDMLKGRYIGDLTASYEKEICHEAPLTLSLAREGDSFSFLVSAPDCPKHFTAGGTLREEDER